MTQKINAEGLDLVKRWEGLELKAYQDAVGVWTVGHGHTGSDVFPWTEISAGRAEELLRKDIRTAENAVIAMVSVRLNPNQFSALASFVFNLGGRAFRESTLRACVNRKDWQKAADEFPRWNRAGGKVLAGLTARRQDERRLFLKPHTTEA